MESKRVKQNTTKVKNKDNFKILNIKSENIKQLHLKKEKKKKSVQRTKRIKNK